MKSKKNKDEFGSRRIFYRIDENSNRIKVSEEEATHYMYATKNNGGRL